MILPAYRGLSRLLVPGVRLLLRRRVAQGKEDPERLGERMGRPSRPRPEGPLVWVHAVSLGEAMSALPVIERLRARPDPPSVLLTTGTVTSAKLMADRLPQGAFHQFAPVDAMPWVQRFLRHWKPDLALWIESELWPSLLHATAERGTPLVMVNGRISERSFRRWRRLPGAATTLLGGFDLVIAQTQESAARFRTLGARRVEMAGNLKYAAMPLPVDPDALAVLQARLGADPAWLAASTHPGEEDLIARAHAAAAARVPDMKTLIVPRHPARGPEIEARLRAQGLSVERRGAGGEIDPSDPMPDVYLADTLGELGLFYRLVDIVFVGGSLVRHGGQNPIEAALLDSAILHGPHMENFPDIEVDFREAGAAARVEDPAALGDLVAALMTDSDRRSAMARAARTVAEDHKAVINRVMDRIEPFLIAFLRSRHARP